MPLFPTRTQNLKPLTAIFRFEIMNNEFKILIKENMNKILFPMLFLIMSFDVSAQDIVIRAETENSNGKNGKFTDYSIALQNINAVEILDIQKEEADIFLKSETYFPNLSYLSIHFAKKCLRTKRF